MDKNQSVRERQLEKIIRDIMWAARRYANNRRTYAPTMINEAIALALELGVDIAPDTVDGIEMFCNDGDYGKWNKEKRRFEKE